MEKVILSLLCLLSFNLYSQESMTMTLDPSSVEVFEECKWKARGEYVYSFGVVVPLSDELYKKAISQDYIVFVIHDPEENRDFSFGGFEIGDSGKRPVFSISYNHPQKEMVLSIWTQMMSSDEKEAVMNFIKANDQ